MNSGIAITVYCSSSGGIDPGYLDQATQLGGEIGRRGHTLVYGGATVGSMGRVAEGVAAGGGRVVGVIPQAMVDVEVARHDCDELVITDGLRDRKEIMDQRADAFVALPGGFGTYEELFEVLTAKQLGWHRRPIVLVDRAGFWRPFEDLCDHLFAERFAKPEFRRIFEITDDVAAAVDRCEAGDAGDLPSKWSDR